jgi:thymidylate synthase ThyX
MGIEATVIADSVSSDGKRLTTLQVKFHRFILPEVNTHRVFSRNYSSSRAIPTAKLIEQIETDPATPLHLGKNKPGMQASEELSEENKESALLDWFDAAYSAAEYMQNLADLGVHKQVVNRIGEPFMWSHGVISSTEWSNFFELRCHSDAQPEMQSLANAMAEAIDKSTPVLKDHRLIHSWHLPYVNEGEIEHWKTLLETSLSLDKNHPYSIDLLYFLPKVSAARCARVSYLKHDGSSSKVAEDIELFNRLAKSRPMHLSPLEHQAIPDFKIESNSPGLWAHPNYHGNFKGWSQFRKHWEDVSLPTTIRT